MDRLSPRSAARRLASELKLPSWKGAVLTMTRGEREVLVVAADERWLSQAHVPATYCGYAVEQDNALDAWAQA